ncbi:MAG: alpha/beta hydrolase, partial [Bradyrhizobium sp.]|nr:alpha/beta hydrolase [Bradyrhizobium sp.]
MRSALIRCALALVVLTSAATAEESTIRVGALDAVLTTPAGIERPPVALLIAGSGSTDRDGNGPQLKPATLKKLADQLAARGIASLRFDKRGARGW